MIKYLLHHYKMARLLFVISPSQYLNKREHFILKPALDQLEESDVIASKFFRIQPSAVGTGHRGFALPRKIFYIAVRGLYEIHTAE